jgi:DNA polymerase-3 subunit chi
LTQIAFHFGAPDKVAYTCRLLRKAVSSGARVVVTGEEQTLQALDTQLWALAPTEFIAHASSVADPDLAERSPVLLCETLSNLTAARPVLVNLLQDIPGEFAQFDRLIEVVSLDEDDRALARLRWRRYAQLGFAIERQDLKLKGLH